MTTLRDHVDRITRQAAVAANVDPDSDARQELASHLYDLARDRAVGRQVTRTDIDEAWAELEPQAIYLLAADEATGPSAPPHATSSATAPPVSKARTEGRGASWTLRFLAYVCDVALVFIAETLAIVFIVDGIHVDARLAPFLIIPLLLAAPVTLVRLEARRGGTPGKLLFRLGTVNQQGGNPSWRQATAITIPKLFPPLVVLDTILGLLIRGRQRVRLTERLAKVRVVRRP